MSKWLLVDGFNLAYRCFHAMPELTRADGFPTGALHGWVKSLWKLIDLEKPDATLVFFDLGESADRVALLAGYKAQRKPMPDALRQQIDPIKALTRAMGLAGIEQQGVESDDLLAAEAVRRAAAGDDVVIVSSDKDFAQIVGDETRLDYLYVLTVADINATNPTLWNSWRASLLRQLYTETKRALRRGLENPVDREEQIRQTQSAALDILVRNGNDQDDVEQLWSQLGDDYFLRHTSADVALHTEAILQQPADGGPLVLIKETTQREFEGGTQIFIYAPDQHDFFAVTVAAMDQLNLNIHDARIITSSSKFTLDTYIVLDNDGETIGNNPARVERIRKGLTEALRNPDDYPNIIQRRVPRQLKHFAFPPQVTIHNDAQRPVTVLELSAPDRPGLLARIGMIFLEFDLSLQNAKIATLGERVEDVFFVTDENNQPLSDPQLCMRLQEAIVEQLTVDKDSTPEPWRLSI